MVVGGVVAVFATAALVVGQLVDSETDDSTSGAISADWTRVVLVDDQALIRAGFRAIIDSADDLDVVGEQFRTAGAPVDFSGGWDVLAAIGVGAVAVPVVAYFYPPTLEEMPSEPVLVCPEQELPVGAHHEEVPLYAAPVEVHQPVHLPVREDSPGVKGQIRSIRPPLLS